VATLGVNVKGNIAVTERLAPGRALARLTDLGWGGPLREVFAAGATDAPASQAMTAACIRVLAEWKWEERPVAVVAMPSRTHPLLIDSVAHALAQVGRLPYLGTLEPAGGGPTGTSGGNSAYRLAAVWERFAVGIDLAAALTTAAPDGCAGRPVLLIDDVADSRWTLTVAGRALRQAGAGSVLPFTLALRA
jgi:ATP-dependent DNA helicase RecQ